MSRYTCHNCKVEHGTDNMVAYCAACYSDLRAQLAAEKEKFRPDSVWVKEMEVENQALRDRAEAAEAALAKERERAEEIKSGAEKFYNEATHLLDLADEKIAALTEQLRKAEAERDLAIKGLGDEARLRGLTESALTASQSEVKALTEKVAGLTAVLEKILSVLWSQGVKRGVLLSLYQDAWSEASVALRDTSPILAAHDSAKQAELVEHVAFAQSQECQVCDATADLSDRPGAHTPTCKALTAILARYPKAAKEDK